ncbi:MAG: HAMP domain-containing histidine kinase [Bacteroidetes bacterium]|nr:HAMP domain-containing histidine kinase [Bacteroidota bacterium]
MLSPAFLTEAKLDIRSLQILIDDSANPTFIIDAHTHEIVCANEAAVTGCGTEHVAGWSLSTFMVSTSESSFGELVYFDNQWLRIHHTPFNYTGVKLVKVVVKPDEQLPTQEMLSQVSDLNALLLHRFRSPLTGIQGFVHLLKNPMYADRADVYVDKISEGINQIIEMLEELDLLQSLEREREVLYSNEQVAIGLTAEQVANAAVSSSGKPVVVQRSRQEPLVYTNESKLQHALRILVQNAVHFNASDKPVRVEIDQNRIRVINYGTTIPTEIAQRVFHPFITTESQRLGIGLTLAHILLRQIGSSVFLKQNDAQKGVLFEIMLPPQ